MAHYLGDTIESTIVLLDATGNRVTGAVGAGTISANLYNPLGIWDSSPAVTEIGVTGMYRCEFTEVNAGAWKLLWACTSPICSTVRVYDYRTDPFIALTAAIAALQADVTTLLAAVAAVQADITALLVDVAAVFAEVENIKDGGLGGWVAADDNLHEIKEEIKQILGWDTQPW